MKTVKVSGSLLSKKGDCFEKWERHGEADVGYQWWVGSL